MLPITRHICHSNYDYRLASITYQPKRIGPILVQGIKNFNSQFKNPIHHITMEEVAYQIRHLHPENHGVNFFPKSQTGWGHSCLTFTKPNGDSCLFFKAKSRNRNFLDKAHPSFEHEKPTMEAGSFKIIKMTGLLITISRDMKNCSIERYVSLSQDSERLFKDEKLERVLGEDLIEEGFTPLKFWDAAKKTNRVIYIMPHLGERIDSQWLKISDDKLKKNLMLDLIQQVKTTKPNDIKYPNTLLSVTADKINLIDTKTPHSTYTPCGHDQWKGKYAYHADKQEMQRVIMKLNCYRKERENFILIHNLLSESKGKIKSFQNLTIFLDQEEQKGIRINNKLKKRIFEEQKYANHFSIDFLIEKINMDIKKLTEFISNVEAKITPAPESVFEEARIFSLTLLLWELINPEYQNCLLKITMYNEEKPDPSLFDESVRYLLKMNADDDLPSFTNTLRLAYARSLSYDQLKSAIEDLFP